MELKYKATENMLVREAVQKMGVSKRALTSIKFEGGKILVNDVERNVRHLLEIGDIVSVIFPAEIPSDGLLVEDGPIDIIYEDDVLLILNKRPGQQTIPSILQPTGSLANSVLGYYLKQSISSTIHVVTRLDKDTSGLVCLAKNRHIHHLMKEAITSKKYVAFISGEIMQNQTIEKPIARKSDSIIEREVREDGQYAKTDVSIVAKYNNWSEVSCILHTGRTHQIRVHLSSIGHPIIGDDLYGGDCRIMKRQALHCGELVLNHPITQEMMTIQCPPPEDMQRFKAGYI